MNAVVLLDDKGQVSFEMLLVVGVLLIIAVMFFEQVKAKAGTWSSVLNSTSDRATQLMNSTW